MYSSAQRGSSSTQTMMTHTPTSLPSVFVPLKRGSSSTLAKAWVKEYKPFVFVRSTRKLLHTSCDECGGAGRASIRPLNAEAPPHTENLQYTVTETISIRPLNAEAPPHLQPLEMKTIASTKKVFVRSTRKLLHTVLMNRAVCNNKYSSAQRGSSSTPVQWVCRPSEKNAYSSAQRGSSSTLLINHS